MFTFRQIDIVVKKASANLRGVCPQHQLVHSYEVPPHHQVQVRELLPHQNLQHSAPPEFSSQGRKNTCFDDSFKGTVSRDVFAFR
jgi:hypothetical protein